MNMNHLGLLYPYYGDFASIYNYTNLQSFLEFLYNVTRSLLFQIIEKAGLLIQISQLGVLTLIPF